MSLPESSYLNTDLDIKSNDDLTPLAKYFERGASVLNCSKYDEGFWYLCVESYADCMLDEEELKNYNFSPEVLSEVTQPHRHILDLIIKIENLPAELKELWKGAFLKEFNIGIDTGLTHCYVTKIEHSILSRVTSIGAQIGFTTYPCDEVREKF